MTTTIAVKESCEHRLAGRDTHRCPECGGTMRRCCDSVIGTAHKYACQAKVRNEAGYARAEEQSSGG